MIPTLSPATIGGAPPLPDFIDLAGRTGFCGIEFSIDDAIALAGQSDWETVASLFIDKSIVPATFGLPVNWRGDLSQFKIDLHALPEKAEGARKLGCTRTCTWIMPATDSSADEWRAIVHKRFCKIAEVLADYNIRLGLEFVGPETLRVGPKAMGKHPFVHTIGQTLDLIEEIDAKADNVGLLLDSFHWYTTHGSPENIIMLRPQQIVHVHINDAPNVPVSQQLDQERLLPGDGVIDLNCFLDSLKAIGYNGPVAVETFNKELTALGPEVAAGRAGVAMKKVMAKVL